MLLNVGFVILNEFLTLLHYLGVNIEVARPKRSLLCRHVTIRVFYDLLSSCTTYNLPSERLRLKLELHFVLTMENYKE
jgi:hypothetical protein